jgi:hypothetical protein
MATSKTESQYVLSQRAQAGCKASLDAVLRIVAGLRVSEDARSRLAVQLISRRPVLAGYRGTGSLESYLQRCATNRVREEARVARRREGLLREASGESHFTRRSRLSVSVIDDRRLELRDLLHEPCVAMHFAHGAVGRPCKLLTAAESGFFRTLAGLCRMHEALLSGRRPAHLPPPHAAFRPLLQLYAETGGSMHLVELGAESLLETIGNVELGIKRASQRDQPKLRELYTHLGNCRNGLITRMRAA